MMDLLQSRNLKSISASCNYNVSNLPGFPGQADGDCGSSTNYYGQILLIVMDQSLSLSKWYQFPSITAAWICYEQYICHTGMQTWWWASVRSLLDERLRRWSSSDPTLLQSPQAACTLQLQENVNCHGLETRNPFSDPVASLWAETRVRGCGLLPCSGLVDHPVDVSTLYQPYHSPSSDTHQMWWC